MILTRFYPNRDAVALQDEVQRLFSDTDPNGSTPAWAPAADVHETEDEYTFRMDLPGVNPKDVKVEMNGGVLGIRGERQETKDEKRGKAHRLERMTGSFARSWKLRAPVDPAKVKASYKDGVLEIHVPKLEEAKAREISIEIA